MYFEGKLLYWLEPQVLQVLSGENGHSVWLMGSAFYIIVFFPSGQESKTESFRAQAQETPNSEFSVV